MGGQQRGTVIGHPGGSLSNADWTDRNRANIGQKGEERTGAILNALAGRAGGPSVIHDARIPLPGVKANIDHLVISGSVVIILDSKVWAPGFYWTLFGTTRRGWSKFPSADKRTVPMAVDGITRYLAEQGIRAHVGTPRLIVWASNRRSNLSLTFLRSPGASSIDGEVFQRAPQRFVGGKPADPQLLAALAKLAR